MTGVTDIYRHRHPALPRDANDRLPETGHGFGDVFRDLRRGQWVVLDTFGEVGGG